MQDRDWQLAQAFYHFRKKFKTFKLVHNKSKVFWDKQTQSGLTCPTLLSNTGTSWPFSSRSQRLPKDTASLKTDPQLWLVLNTMKIFWITYMNSLKLTKICPFNFVVVLDRHRLHNSIPNHRLKYIHLKVNSSSIFLCTPLFTSPPEIYIHNLKVYHLWFLCLKWK